MPKIITGDPLLGLHCLEKLPSILENTIQIFIELEDIKPRGLQSRDVMFQHSIILKLMKSSWKCPKI